MAFKKWIEKRLKKRLGEDSLEVDFMGDVLRDKKWREPKNWQDMVSYLERRRACAEAIEAAKVVFETWQMEDPKARIDGMSRKLKEQVRKATRQVWSWSYPKKLCIERATGTDGFFRCEGCRKTVPKIFVDHITQVGEVDAGYLDRLFCPSTGLQALCKQCHDGKTREERKSTRVIKDFF